MKLVALEVELLHLFVADGDALWIGSLVDLRANAQSWKRGSVEYRVGDKVMQIVNNYDKLPS
jgi:hypothetical protein